MINFHYLLACSYEQNHDSDYKQQKAVFGDNAVHLLDEQNQSLNRMETQQSTTMIQ
jgi:hypothetical protein